MLAKEVMSKKPEFMLSTATLREAADEMKSHDFGFIPVGENDKLIGAVTDRDITIRGVAKGFDPAKTTIKEIMTKGIHYCFEDDDVNDVAQMMEQLQIRRLVVLNKDKRLTGIISLGDIATKCSDKNLVSEVTEAVSTEG